MLREVPDEGDEPPALMPGARWYRYYVLALLTVMFAFSTMDRTLLAILQEPIRADLHLTDSQLGVLSGLAFAVLYSTLSLPIARIADKGNRVAVASCSLGVWSLMTMGCGAAAGFVSLLVFRIGVGVGEAGGHPSAASILADYFDRESLTTAMSIFGLGSSIGLGLGLFAGGTLNGLIGWRATFVAIGGAGVVLAPLLYVSISNPRRGAMDSTAVARTFSLGEVFSVLFGLRSFRLLLAASCLHGFVVYGLMAWMPSYYIRGLGVPTTDAASILGLLTGAGGAAGTLCGGLLAGRLGSRDEKWYAWVVGVSCVVLVPLALAQFSTHDLRLSILLAIVPQCLLMVFIAPTVALTQSLVLPGMRAMAAAVVLLCFNLIGLGLGPTLAGVLSDLFARRGAGNGSIGQALVLLVLLDLPAAAAYFGVGRYLKADLRRDMAADLDPRRKRGSATLPQTESST